MKHRTRQIEDTAQRGLRALVQLPGGRSNQGNVAGNLSGAICEQFRPYASQHSADRKGNCWMAELRDQFRGVALTEQPLD